MIKLNDEYSIKPNSSAGWEVHHFTPNTNPKAKTEYTVKITYHGNLAQVINYIIDKSLGRSDGLFALRANLHSIKTWAVRSFDEIESKARDALLENEKLKAEVERLNKKLSP